jgi:galactokinase/mevalonate kinase-like predicted kinase
MSDVVFALIPILALSIPVFGIVLTGFRRWADLKEKQLEIAARTAGEQAAQYAAKIERLEAHVAVLNRIVTDRNEGLTAQIESLRDAPPITGKIN